LFVFIKRSNCIIQVQKKRKKKKKKERKGKGKRKNNAKAAEGAKGIHSENNIYLY
jgi:hypothetical protein